VWGKYCFRCIHALRVISVSSKRAHKLPVYIDIVFLFILKCFIVAVIYFYGIVVSLSLLFDECKEVCLFWFISESFVLCKTYCPPPQYVPNVDKSVLCLAELSDSHHPRFPFKACGNQISYDSDTTYPLQVCSDQCYKHYCHCTIIIYSLNSLSYYL
jgi:hypothetical protein